MTYTNGQNIGTYTGDNFLFVADLSFNLNCFIDEVYGCSDENYLEYNPSANIDDGSCVNPIILGCTDDSYLEFNPFANINDESCLTLLVSCPALEFESTNTGNNMTLFITSTALVGDVMNEGDKIEYFIPMMMENLFVVVLVFGKTLNSRFQHMR